MPQGEITGYNDLGKFVFHGEHWSKAGVECYLRSCRCEGCFYNQFENYPKCQMKASVLEMVKRLGKPSTERLIEASYRMKLERI